MKLFNEIIRFRRGFITVATLCLWCMSYCTPAQAGYYLPSTGKVVFIKKKNRLILNAQDATIKQVLRKVGRKNGIAFHFSDLPNTPISFSCVERDLPKLIKCGLQHQADIALRYRYDKKKHRTKIAEAWITPFQLATYKKQSEPACPPQDGGGLGHGAALPASVQQDDQAALKRQQLLEQAQSSDPATKAQALAQLPALGRQDDSYVRDILERALTDKDPEVRAQAVSGLSHVIKGDATAAVQQGLQDNDENVRLMAVEGITYDEAILEQAMGDKDEAVRSLAELKLKLLNRQQNRSESPPVE